MPASLAFPTPSVPRSSSVLVLAIVASASACTGASPGTASTAGGVVVASTELDQLADSVLRATALPGLALSYARPGEDPRVGVAGARVAASQAAVERSDRFHIGSITKSMTATVIARLVERGLLSFEDTLGALLPDVPMRDAYRGITLERLLRHRARIVAHLTMNDEEMARHNNLPGTPSEQRHAYATEVLSLEPLEDRYHYSNAGYAVAAHVAEQRAGRGWEELVVEEVFEPLRLTSCEVGWPANAARPDQPRGHFGDDRAALRVQEVTEYRLGAFISPAGNVSCSAGDLARYGLAHLDGLLGTDGYLQASTIQELHRVDDVPYASGWGVDPRSGQHRHRGSAGSFLAYLTLDPKARIAVVFMTNVGPALGGPAAGPTADLMIARFAQ